MCYYENGTVNGETYLLSVFGILGVGHQNERTVRPLGPDGPLIPRLD
jgi:hypothetical protein